MTNNKKKETIMCGLCLPCKREKKSELALFIISDSFDAHKLHVADATHTTLPFLKEVSPSENAFAIHFINVLMLHMCTWIELHANEHNTTIKTEREREREKLHTTRMTTNCWHYHFAGINFKSSVTCLWTEQELLTQ